MFKRIISLAITLVGLFAINSFAEDNLSVYINDEKIEFDISAQMINGRTMVSMREIYENLGAVVGWFGDNLEIWSIKDNNVVTLNIDKNIIVVNSDEVALDVPPFIVDKHTLVPLRAVSESFGADVEWDGETRSVYIRLNNENQFCFDCYGTGFYSENADCKNILNDLFESREKLQIAIKEEKLESVDIREIYNEYTELLRTYESYIVEYDKEINKCNMCDGKGVLSSEIENEEGLEDNAFQKLVSCIKNKGESIDTGYVIKVENGLISYNEEENTIGIVRSDKSTYELVVTINDSDKVTYQYKKIKTNEDVKGRFMPQILIEELEYMPYFECNISSTTKKQITKDVAAELKKTIVSTEKIIASLENSFSLTDLGFVVTFTDIESEIIEEDDTKEVFDWYQSE